MEFAHLRAFEDFCQAINSGRPWTLRSAFKFLMQVSENPRWGKFGANQKEAVLPGPFAEAGPTTPNRERDRKQKSSDDRCKPPKKLWNRKP